MSYLQKQQEYLCLSYHFNIDSVVAVLSCSVFIYCILWCLLLLLVGPGINFLLIPRIGIMSYTHVVTFKLLHKKQQILQVVFRSSGSLSTSSMRSSYTFCNHLISVLLFDTMSDFPSVFTRYWFKVRINSAVPSFGKQQLILSGNFPKSSISLVGCCCERR